MISGEYSSKIVVSFIIGIPLLALSSDAEERRYSPFILGYTTQQEHCYASRFQVS